MIVHDLDVFRVPVNPAEANPKLVVDTDAVLPGTITLERFQPVARRYAQKIQRTGSVHKIEFSACHRLDVYKTLHSLPVEQCLSIGAVKALNHRCIVYRLTIYRKRFRIETETGYFMNSISASKVERRGVAALEEAVKNGNVLDYVLNRPHEGTRTKDEIDAALRKERESWLGPSRP